MYITSATSVTATTIWSKKSGRRSQILEPDSGSFARVWKIKLRSYDCDDSEPIIPEYFEQALALKEFTKHTLIDLLNKTEDYNQSKEYAISHDVAELANWEVRLLKAVTPHPFISKYIKSFQDKSKAYILMEHIPWGDLLYHMKIEK